MGIKTKMFLCEQGFVIPQQTQLRHATHIAVDVSYVQKNKAQNTYYLE